MSRDASKTTAKSNMVLSTMKDNEETLTFVTESPTLYFARVLDMPPDVFKDIIKITVKMKRNDKVTYTLLIHRETR